MKKTLLVITTIVITALVACTKKPVTPTRTTSTKPVVVDSCGCQQITVKGYALGSTDPIFTTIDTIYWKFPIKDTNALCKGHYFSDTLRISYKQIP